MEDITRFPLVPFRNWDCRAVPAIYGNGIVAIQLIETDPSQFELSHHNLTCEDGDETGDVYRQTIATATVNLIDYEDKVLKFSDVNYSFEEVLSIAKKIEQMKESRLL